MSPGDAGQDFLRIRDNLTSCPHFTTDFHGQCGHWFLRCFGWMWVNNNNPNLLTQTGKKSGFSKTDQCNSGVKFWKLARKDEIFHQFWLDVSASISDRMQGYLTSSGQTIRSLFNGKKAQPNTSVGYAKPSWTSHQIPSSGKPFTDGEFGVSQEERCCKCSVCRRVQSQDALKLGVMHTSAQLQKNTTELDFFHYHWMRAQTCRTQHRCSFLLVKFRSNFEMREEPSTVSKGLWRDRTAYLLGIFLTCIIIFPDFFCKDHREGY